MKMFTYTSIALTMALCAACAAVHAQQSSRTDPSTAGGGSVTERNATVLQASDASARDIQDAANQSAKIVQTLLKEPGFIERTAAFIKQHANEMREFIKQHENEMTAGLALFLVPLILCLWSATARYFQPHAHRAPDAHLTDFEIAQIQMLQSEGNLQ